MKGVGNTGPIPPVPVERALRHIEALVQIAEATKGKRVRYIPAEDCESCFATKRLQA